MGEGNVTELSDKKTAGQQCEPSTDGPGYKHLDFEDANIDNQSTSREKITPTPGTSNHVGQSQGNRDDTQIQEELTFGKDQ